MRYAFKVSMTSASSAGRPYEQALSSRVLWLLGDIFIVCEERVWIHSDDQPHAAIVLLDDPSDQASLAHLARSSSHPDLPTLLVHFGRHHTSYQSESSTYGSRGQLAHGQDVDGGFADLRTVVIQWLAGVSVTIESRHADPASPSDTETLADFGDDFFRTAIEAPDGPLALARRVSEVARKSVEAVENPESTDVLLVSIFKRCLRVLEGIVILLEADQRELAESIARQLFELRVNVEYLVASGDAKRRYAKFAILQHLLRQRAEYEYSLEVGRAVDQGHLAEIERILSGQEFEEYRDRKRRFRDNWSGKSVRSLAEESSSPMLGKQYRLIYGGWSNEVHAGPIAVASEASLGVGRDDSDVRILRAIRTDEVASISVQLFLEVWKLLEIPNDPTGSDEIAGLMGSAKARLDAAWKRFEISTGTDRSRPVSDSQSIG